MHPHAVTGTRGRARAVPRIAGLRTLADPNVLSVDTLDRCGTTMLRWREFCPFHVRPVADIVVPGRADLRSRSVEAVWQGLKLVDGSLDLAQLDGVPRKRPPEHLRRRGYSYADSRFLLGEREIPLVTARYLLYVPVYVQLLSELADRALLARVDEWLDSGRDVVFYDWDENTDLDDARTSFSHSGLLARWFNGTLGPVLERAAQEAAAW